jgi:hypothetical protein
MKHYTHIIRSGIILIVVVTGFFAVRSIVVPESFGIHGTYTYGYHRGDSDAEQASLSALYQGSAKCKKCHEEQYEFWKAGGHIDVACETCHGYWQAHNNNTKDKVVTDRSIESCMQCHQRLDARPTAFSQIADFKLHMEEQEQEIEKGMTCIECHDPHEPM